MLATFRNRNFSLLWLAGLISLTGDWVLWVGLPIYVYNLTESTLATAATIAAGAIPRILFGSVAGVFVDRWDRRRTMLIANLVMAGGLLPLLLVTSAEQVWIVLFVKFFQSCVVQFFIPAEGALLPLLVGEDHLVPANALNTLNNNLARLIGPALGGLIAAVGSLSAIALFDAVTFLIAAALIALIRAPRKPSVNGAKPRVNLRDSLAGVWREWGDGFAFIRSEPRLSRLLLILTLPMIGEGMFGTLFVPFVQNVLGGGELAVGSLTSAQAVGGLVGSVFVGAVAKRMPVYQLFGISAILIGVIDLGLFNYSKFIPGVLLGHVLLAVVGIPVAGYMTGYYTLLQTAAPDEFRGRVLGALGALSALLALVGMGIAGVLGNHVSVVALLTMQSIGYALAGVLALVLLRKFYSVAVGLEVK